MEEADVEPAAPKLAFEQSAVTKTYGDAAFVNKLSFTTDGEIRYSSSNENIADVNENGRVTIVGVGETIITATSEETDNYTEGKASYILTVKLAAPVISSVANNEKGVAVKWGAVNGATKYSVYYKGGSVKSWTLAGDTASTSYTVTGLTSGTTYSFTVKCISPAVSSYDTTGMSVKYLSAGTISSLTNTAKGVKVKWTKVTGAKGYYVYRKAGSGSWKKVKTIKKNATTSYTDTGVKSQNGKICTYKVIPYSGSTKAAYVTAKTVRLTGVSISSVKNVKGKKMTVKWKKDSKVIGYEIQYSLKSNFSSTKTVTVKKKAMTSTTESRKAADSFGGLDRFAPYPV